MWSFITIEKFTSENQESSFSKLNSWGFGNKCMSIKGSHVSINSTWIYIIYKTFFYSNSEGKCFLNWLQSKVATRQPFSLPVTWWGHEVNCWVQRGFPILSWGILDASFLMFKHVYNSTGCINVKGKHIMWRYHIHLKLEKKNGSFIS